MVLYDGLHYDAMAVSPIQVCALIADHCDRNTTVIKVPAQGMRLPV